MDAVIGVLLAGGRTPVPRWEEAIDEPCREMNQTLACGRADRWQPGLRGAAWRHDGLPVAQGWFPRALRLVYRQRGGKSLAPGDGGPDTPTGPDATRECPHDSGV